jgi:hypothetical protein
MNAMRLALISLISLVLLSSVSFAQSESGAVCVAPNAALKPERCAPGLCRGGELSLRLDKGRVIEWPKEKSLEIPNLALETRHRVTIYRAGKPQQSFTFKFSRFKSRRPCLFLNDLYWTAQLWESKEAPWCKCE